MDKSFNPHHKYYLNAATGEITFFHDEAVAWYRAGNSIEIWINGRCVLTWVF